MTSKDRVATTEGTTTLKEAVDAQTGQIERNVRTEMARLSPLFNPGELLNLPTSDMSPEQAAAAYAMLDLMESVAASRKEQIRERIFQIAEAQGVADERGSYRAFVEGTKLGKRRNTSTKPDEKKLKDLLVEERVQVIEVFDEVKVLQMNLSRLEYLVETGRLPKAKVDALRKVTFSIELEPSQAISEYLAQAKAMLAGLPAEKLLPGTQKK